MDHVTYTVEVVGTRVAERMKDEQAWVRYLRAAWQAIGTSAVKNIQEQIAGISWKNPTGRFARAVAWEAQDYSLIVYMDPNIAPHAIYQELGVKTHIMRYLLNATGPIPIPTGENYMTDPKGKYPRTVFRTALEKWMGVPHPYVDHRGQTRMATGWVHPGYEGKKFFEKGIIATMEETQRHLRGLVFKLIKETGE